jgi:hypothetical protein
LESLWFGAPVSRAVEKEFGGTQVGEVGCSIEVRSARSEARRGQGGRRARYPERVREVVKSSGSLP